MYFHRASSRREEELLKSETGKGRGGDACGFACEVRYDVLVRIRLRAAVICHLAAGAEAVMRRAALGNVRYLFLGFQSSLLPCLWIFRSSKDLDPFLYNMAAYSARALTLHV